jgi:hypothetical protein
MRAAKRFIGRGIGAMKLLAHDRRIPRPVRWLLALGLLPIPGPLDEALLLVMAAPVLILYRGPMREAWERAQQP